MSELKQSLEKIKIKLYSIHFKPSQNSALKEVFYSIKQLPVFIEQTEFSSTLRNKVFVIDS